MDLHRITFLPAGQSASFEDGENFRDAALALGILIESTCAGIGTCAKCKVRIQGGASAPARSEEELLSPAELAQGVRLSCQALVTGDSVCVIPRESQAQGMQILSEGLHATFPVQPDLRKVHLELPEPVLGEKYFDAEHLTGRLRLSAPPALPVLRQLPGLLREHDFRVTALIDSGHLIAVEGGDTTGTLYGAAVDIGTTTVVVKIVDLISGRGVGVASALNAQRPYGADVVARINYCVEHPGGLELLQRLVVRQINELIGEACATAGLPREAVGKVVAVGNTVMQHLLLKIDPRNVAFMPYAPAFQGPATFTAADLGILIHPRGTIYVAPNLACFVGSDITSVLTVLDVDERDEIQLVVDIGTNGEMVLGSRERMLCASSPAGPAWEGAYIAWGMRAARGAIERAEISSGDLELRTIGHAPPIGICGSGLLDLVSEFLRAGIIEKSGRVLGADEAGEGVSTELRKRIVRQQSGANDLAIVPLADGQSMYLTQKDVREVQLAKGAIAAGIEILMKEMGVRPSEIATVYVAGAFGNHVRGQDAVGVGLIPDVPPERIRFVGNAALSGAEAILVSSVARRKAEHLARSVGYVEISGRPDFQEVFVNAMHFRIGR